MDLLLGLPQEREVRVVHVGVLDEPLQQQPVPRHPLEWLGQQSSETKPLNTRFYLSHYDCLEIPIKQ